MRPMLQRNLKRLGPAALRQAARLDAPVALARRQTAWYGAILKPCKCTTDLFIKKHSLYRLFI